MTSNGWGATAVDGLSTAIIMNEGEIVNKVLRQISETNFTRTAVDGQAISLFETTIRYLGGLLSGMFLSIISSPIALHVLVMFLLILQLYTNSL